MTDVVSHYLRGAVYYPYTSAGCMFLQFSRILTTASGNLLTQITSGEAIRELDLTQMIDNRVSWYYVNTADGYNVASKQPMTLVATPTVIDADGVEESKVWLQSNSYSEQVYYSPVSYVTLAQSETLTLTADAPTVFRLWLNTGTYACDPVVVRAV